MEIAVSSYPNSYEAVTTNILHMTQQLSRNFWIFVAAWQSGNEYDVIKWKHFPHYCPFVRGTHRSPVNSPHKGQWCGALMFSFIPVSVVVVGWSRGVSTWWRHQMETFSTLLAICAGNSPVTGEFHTQRPVTWSFDFFYLRLNRRLNKQSWGWWFETLDRAHYAVIVMNMKTLYYQCGDSHYKDNMFSPLSYVYGNPHSW